MQRVIPSVAGSIGSCINFLELLYPITTNLVV